MAPSIAASPASSACFPVTSNCGGSCAVQKRDGQRLGLRTDLIEVFDLHRFGRRLGGTFASSLVPGRASVKISSPLPHNMASLRALRYPSWMGLGLELSSKGASMIVDCPSVHVVDGDTLRCGEERLRLLGIDAPELGRCPRRRVCAPGDGKASKASLAEAVRLGPVRYRPVTVDRYGRQVAIVWAGEINLSCWQLRHEQAVYKPRWDNGHLVERACR
jgi:endonuclease YncB( thermonuclease family)